VIVVVVVVIVVVLVVLVCSCYSFQLNRSINSKYATVLVVPLLHSSSDVTDNLRDNC
jgi:hypothetical protein